MENMNITSAQYTTEDDGTNNGITATIDGRVYHVPLTADNRHYAVIMRQVEAGELTIQDAE